MSAPAESNSACRSGYPRCRPACRQPCATQTRVARRKARPAADSPVVAADLNLRARREETGRLAFIALQSSGDLEPPSQRVGVFNCKGYILPDTGPVGGSADKDAAATGINRIGRVASGAAQAAVHLSTCALEWGAGQRR